MWCMNALGRVLWRHFLMFPLKATEMPSGLRLLQSSRHKHLIAFGFGGSRWENIRVPSPTSYTVRHFLAKNGLTGIIFTRGKMKRTQDRQWVSHEQLPPPVKKKKPQGKKQPGRSFPCVEMKVAIRRGRGTRRSADKLSHSLLCKE